MAPRGRARGTSVDQKDKHSRTALHVAAYAGHVEVIKALLESGANAKAAAMDSTNALHFAAMKGHSEACRALINAGVSVNSKTRKGMMALHFASQGGHKELAQLLLKRRANAGAANARGQLPFELAKGEELKTLLREAAATAAQHGDGAAEDKAQEEPPAAAPPSPGAAAVPDDDDKAASKGPSLFRKRGRQEKAKEAAEAAPQADADTPDGGLDADPSLGLPMNFGSAQDAGGQAKKRKRPAGSKAGVQMRMDTFYAVLEGPLLPYLDRASRIQLAATSTRCFSAIARSRSALRPLRYMSHDFSYEDVRRIQKDLQSLRVLSRCVRPGEPNCAGTIEFPQFSINAGDVHALLTALAASSPLDLAVLAGTSASDDARIAVLAAFLQRAAAASTNGPLRVHRLTLEDVGHHGIPLDYVKMILGLPGLHKSLRSFHFDTKLATDFIRETYRYRDAPEAAPDGSEDYFLPVGPIDSGSHAPSPPDAAGHKTASDMLLALLRRAEGLTHVRLQAEYMTCEVFPREGEDARRVLDALARHRRPLAELHVKTLSEGMECPEPFTGPAADELVRLVAARPVEALQLVGPDKVDEAARLLAGGSTATAVSLRCGPMLREKLSVLLLRPSTTANAAQSVVWEALMTNDTTTRLDLAMCDLGDAGLLTAFSQGTARVNTTLRDLRLGANHITLAGCAALARGFPALTHLDMEANPIGFRGVAALLNGLPSLKVAAFANMDGTQGGVVELGEAIASNGTVEALKLGACLANNWIGPEGLAGRPFKLMRDGAPTSEWFGTKWFTERIVSTIPNLGGALGRGLGRNTTLERLHLEGLSFGTGSWEALAEGLRGNTTLQRLSLANTGLWKRGTHIAFALSWLGSDTTRNETSAPHEVSLWFCEPDIYQEDQSALSASLRACWEKFVTQAEGHNTPPHKIAKLSILFKYPEEFRSQVPWVVDERPESTSTSSDSGWV
ncbi:unnamed protein product [Pedinophyceae sp. YPF-701]|nr:unnamed protein product [Pedinophyceae sp. YPF-701]